MKRLTAITLAILFCLAGGSIGVRSALGQSGEQSEEKIYLPTEVTVRAKIRSKSEPLYTEEAREHRISGTVIITAVFRASGEVTDISVVKSLPYGLTEACVKVTQQIKFEPAIKDDRKVSQRFQAEYTFTMY